MRELDRIDRGILNILQDDASTPLREIAERVHSSVATCQRRIERLRADGVLVKAVALVDRVLVVDVPVETQLTRLTARDSITETLAQDMVASQTHRQVRLDAAHDVIDNTGTPEDALREVARLHQFYLDLAA